MPTDIIYSDDGTHLEYFSKADPSISKRVYRGNIETAAFVARDWHGGQWTGLYALSSGSFDYATIERAHAEACRAAATFKDDPGASAEANEDAYLGLLGMIDDLASALDPRFGEGARCINHCGRDAAPCEKRCAECIACHLGDES